MNNLIPAAITGSFIICKDIGHVNISFGSDNSDEFEFDII